jgi:purine-binding chemotaxis protein CheW
MTATLSASPAAMQGAVTHVTHAREWLSFKLGGEEYGVDILRVQEIRGYEQPCIIYCAPV